MTQQGNRLKLAETFRLLGATDPESWATSETEEGSPQLAMYVFLRRASTLLGDDQLRCWLKSLAHEHAPEIVTAKRALTRIIQAGVARDDIRTILLQLYRELLMEFCCLVDNTSSSHFDDSELNSRVAHVNWRIFIVDEAGDPVTPMDGLHEIVNDVACDLFVANGA